MTRAFSLLASSCVVSVTLAAAASSAAASALSVGVVAGDAIKAAHTTTVENVIEVNDQPRRRYYYVRPLRRPGYNFRRQFGPTFYVPPPYYVRPHHTAPRYVQQRPEAHVDWCRSKYRSYRMSDNTFQPYEGPRQECRSPYLR